MDAEWLKDNVGAALSEALVSLSRNKAVDPIDFLGKHLLHYVDCKQVEKRQKELAEAAARREEEETSQALAATAHAAAEEERQKYVEQRLNEAVVDHGVACSVDYEELKHGSCSDAGVADDLGVLANAKVNQAVSVISELSSATSVYVGRRNADGSVTIVASGDPSLIGQTLVDAENEEGQSTVLPFQVFKAPAPVEQEEQEQAPESEDGEPVQVKPVEEEPALPQFAHVKNVLRDSRVPFFDRIPTLGSFLAVHVPYKQSIHSAGIPEDGGLIPEEPTAEQEASAEGEAVEVAPREKRWRSVEQDASLVICMDTIGASEFSNGIPEREIEFVRKLARALGQALTETERSRFQAEMRHRDKVAELATGSTPVFELEVNDSAAAAEARIVEYEASITAPPAPEEGTEDAAGYIPPAEVPAPVQSLSKAQIAKAAAWEKMAAAEWWLVNLREWRKLCIEPDAALISGTWTMFKVFGAAAVGAPVPSWLTLKTLDLEDFASKVRSFDADVNCALSLEQANALVDEVSAVSEEAPAWLRLLAHLAKLALANVQASKATQSYYAEVEAARVAAEAEAAELAAAASENADE